MLFSLSQAGGQAFMSADDKDFYKYFQMIIDIVIQMLVD